MMVEENQTNKRNIIFPNTRHMLLEKRYINWKTTVLSKTLHQTHLRFQRSVAYFTVLHCTREQVNMSYMYPVANAGLASCEQVMKDI